MFCKIKSFFFFHSINCLFSFFSNNILQNKLQTSAIFEVGSSFQKVITKTTRPPLAPIISFLPGLFSAQYDIKHCIHCDNRDEQLHICVHYNHHGSMIVTLSGSVGNSKLGLPCATHIILQSPSVSILAPCNNQENVRSIQKCFIN